MVASTLRPVAVLTLLAGGLAEGRAADMLPPPPPPPVAVAPVEVGSGWYLRGDFTQSFYGRPADNTPPDPTDPNMPPLVGLRLKDTAGGGGGIGYRINPWLRIDATVDQRMATTFFAASSRSNFVTGGNIETGRADILTGLVNVYADLGTWWGLTPYIGGGVGFAEVGTRRSFTQTTCFVSGCDGNPGIGPRDAVARPNRTIGSLAWALTAGASYALGNGFSIDAAYRYIEFGKLKTGLDAFGYGTRLKNLTANEFRIGLRYEFAAGPSLAGPRGANPYDY